MINDTNTNKTHHQTRTGQRVGIAGTIQSSPPLQTTASVDAGEKENYAHNRNSDWPDCSERDITAPCSSSCEQPQQTVQAALADVAAQLLALAEQRSLENDEAGAYAVGELGEQLEAIVEFIGPDSYGTVPAPSLPNGTAP